MSVFFQIYKLSHQKYLKITDPGENGKRKLFLTYQFSDNPERLFPCFAMVLSLPTAKHRANFMGFNQRLCRTFFK